MLLAAMVVAAMPFGIPEPSFGLVETAPPAPAPWSAAVPGAYYIDQNVAGATDTANAYGWPAKPRKTIPLTLPAGALVEVHGAYDKSHASPSIVVAHGTAVAPVFIRGVGSTATRPWHFQGSYLIVEGVSWTLASGQSGQALKFVSPADHVVLRNCDLKGNLVGGGVSVYANATFGGVVSDVVIASNAIHDNGDVNISTDQDAHAITINQGVSNAWVLDNTLSESSGDGLQVNAGSKAAQPTTHHIYVGRNHVFRTRQSGLFVKQAEHVVISQNHVHDVIKTSWSPSKGLGYQYAPEDVWFIFNNVWNCEFGVYAGSDSGLGTGQNIYILGNLLHGLHSADAWNPNSAWSTAAIMLAGGTNRYVVANTIADADSGIHTPDTKGTLAISDNIVAGITKGYSVYVQSIQASSSADHDLFDVPSIKWGSTVYGLPGFQALGQCAGCLGGDPGFVTATDWHLTPGSIAIDAGATPAVIASYVLGPSISVDLDGVPRPLGAAWDVGAYEAVPPPPSPTPSPTPSPSPTPQSLTITCEITCPPDGSSCTVAQCR